MSTFVPAVIACPSCGRADEVQLAASINVARTPSYRDAILDGDFQSFTCAGCGTRAVHLRDFVYIDFDAKLFVGVMWPELQPAWPEVEWEADDAFRQNLGRLAPEHARSIGVGFTVRTVFGLSPLREKIVAADLNVGDIDLELVKLRLVLGAAGPDPAIDPTFIPRLVGGSPDDLVLRWPDDRTETVGREALDDARDVAIDPARELLMTGTWVDLGRILLTAGGEVHT